MNLKPVLGASYLLVIPINVKGAVVAGTPQDYVPLTLHGGLENKIHFNPLSNTDTSLPRDKCWFTVMRVPPKNTEGMSPSDTIRDLLFDYDTENVQVGDRILAPVASFCKVGVVRTLNTNKKLSNYDIGTIPRSDVLFAVRIKPERNKRDKVVHIGKEITLFLLKLSILGLLGIGIYASVRLVVKTIEVVTGLVT